MEAAAILVHGASLPPDRSLWPSYTSGGSVHSPIEPDGSNAPFNDDELQEVVEVEVEADDLEMDEDLVQPTSPTLDEEGEGDEDEIEMGEQDEIIEDDENTEESDIQLSSSLSPYPAHPHPYPYPVRRGSLASPVPGQMPNLYGSHGSYGSYGAPLSSSFGWGVITESGKVGHAEYVFLPLKKFLISPLPILHFPLSIIHYLNPTYTSHIPHPTYVPSLILSLVLLVSSSRSRFVPRDLFISPNFISHALHFFLLVRYRSILLSFLPFLINHY
jgi:hypothetical protein